MNILNWKFFSLLVFLFSYSILKSQIYYTDDQTGKEYEINQNTDKLIINKFLQDRKAKAIDFNSNYPSEFPFRLKNKRGNWVLFHAGQESLFMEKEGRKYSFTFPTAAMEDNQYLFASRKGMKFLVAINPEKVSTKLRFDEIAPRYKADTVNRFNQETEEYEELYLNRLTSFTVKKDKKWGLIENGFGDDLYYLSRDFLYNTPEEVPAATGFQAYQLEMMESIRHEYKVDLLIALDQNGYYFKGRNSKSKLFGLYAGEGDVINHIPQKYDNIIRHRNPQTFEVWKDSKVGYYNSAYKLIFEPQFDDFEYVHLDYTRGCALKSNGKWELYDVYEPRKLVEGSAETIDKLIELWLNR